MRTAFVCVLMLTLICCTPGCKQEPRATDDGLKPGLNYMQPFRWRMTYHYRVQEITPDRAYIKPRPSAWNPSIDAVGDGTYQVWFVGPRPGEEIRDVKLVSASPQPTAVNQGGNTDVTFYYYDFAPDGGLPREIDASITWEFVTLERYAFWKGMEIGDYDRSSDFYKEYTAEDDQVKFHHDLKKVVDEIKKENKGDLMKTALGCYNYIIVNFDYDARQAEWISIAGGTALFDTYRAWENKAGVCDEFATTLCAMLRYAGIPARPAAGFVHPMQSINAIDDQKTKNAITRVCDKYGPLLTGGAHAWTEFYFPDVGWIPADATWGQVDYEIDKYQSYIGAKRKIPVVDYYFGKSDPFRITLFKDWDYTLVPAAKGNTPKTEDSFVCYTERTTGIRHIKNGWTGEASRRAEYGLGWYRSEASAGYNFDVELQALGPVADGEIPDAIAAIRDEGANYLRVPAVAGQWPHWTLGRNRAEEMEQDFVDHVTALDKELERDEVSAVLEDLVKRAIER